MTQADIDYEDLKRRGFLKQRQDGFVILRTRMKGGSYSKEHLEKLAHIAQVYGKGIVHATTRQGLEIPFIKLEDITKVGAELKAAAVQTGTSGARVRAVTVCPGNNWCKFGLIDTFAFVDKLEKTGIACGIELPYKFKIAVSGCPNTCTRAQNSDIGIHGQIDTSSPDKRIGYTIYIGGAGGRTPKTGFKLDKIFTEEETLALIKEIVSFYKESAKPRQRLHLLIDEIGREKFLERFLL